MNVLWSLSGVALLALGGGWLMWRARRAQSNWRKWLGLGFGGLLTLVALLVIVLAVRGLYRFYWPPTAPAVALQVASTPQALARGERLAYLCVDCHSNDGTLPLAGDEADFTDGFAGTLHASNLTPAGPLQSWQDGEIIRAIREGVNNEGRALLIMPSHFFHTMSDDDAHALVAYLRAQPAVDKVLPATRLNLLGALVVGAGVFPLSAQSPLAGPVVAPAAGVTAEYGAYLTTIGGCPECHGAALTGGTPGGFVPAGPSLVALLGMWQEAEFVTFMQTGVDPYGRAVDPDQMPWDDYAAAFTADELRAIYRYIHGLG